MARLYTCRSPYGTKYNLVTRREIVLFLKWGYKCEPLDKQEKRREVIEHG